MANLKQKNVKRFIEDISKEVASNAYEGGGGTPVEYKDIVIVLTCDPNGRSTEDIQDLICEVDYETILMTMINGYSVTLKYGEENERESDVTHLYRAIKSNTFAGDGYDIAGYMFEGNSEIHPFSGWKIQFDIMLQRFYLWYNPGLN